KQTPYNQGKRIGKSHEQATDVNFQPCVGARIARPSSAVGEANIAIRTNPVLSGLTSEEMQRAKKSNGRTQFAPTSVFRLV
ncbi:MAG: hypothetical protein LBR71_00430, partial [Synergistaceae bacterium]|nr:hypothetical protein [Synergistaceae bacterium]